MPIFNGNNGNDTINGSNGDDSIFGNGGADMLRGRGGNDSIFGGQGNDTLDGGAGNDALYGEAGNDNLQGDDGNDTLTGGAGNDVINGGSGTDTAVFSSSIFDYSFNHSGAYWFVAHNGGAGADGTDQLSNVERLQFTDVTIILGQNNAPIVRDDGATTDEDSAFYSSGSASVLDNDMDFEGDSMTVTATVIAGAYGTLTMNSDGTYTYELTADVQALAQGQSVQDSFTYTVSDGSLSDTANLVITISGNNDAPVAVADTASTSENATILIDVVANDTDVDNGAVLTPTAASAPAGKGTASVVGNQVQFDPGTAFDRLAVGESEIVVVSYTMADEHGASSSSTITITVTGTNDGPVANPDARTTSESSGVVIDVLANDTDVDNGALLAVVDASAPAGQGTASVLENEVRFDPGNDFDYLASGESAEVIVSYTIVDEYGASASSTITITVQGRDEGESNTGTNGNDTLFGTGGGDTIDALAGDDTVFGLAGDDLLLGGDGNDSLNGEEDDDALEGGNGADILSGGEGNDQILGQAGNDFASGNAGDDQLSGGDGFDSLNGEDGDDLLEGGNNNDFLLGGLGDDTLDGGAGDDLMSDLNGVNSFAGGAGADQIRAGSTDGIQTVDGGDGDDAIIHYYRYFASTITTGLGSDTIEIAYADQGTEAVIVTDFTAGAGGDMFRLSGDDGALLSLLSGWDSGSNPFGTGFLRLEQDGDDTLLQWDQDGAGEDSDWQTLVVFQNTNADDFTEANFEPSYDPAGGAPVGETITGTNGDDTLIGTAGGDTISALAGEDSVFGQAGDDLILGGDGFDNLYGGEDNDTIEGGNHDDSLSGGDGDDQLLGQAGNDFLLGENDDDQLSGGAGGDFLLGGDGDDTLDGGDGDDYLSGGGGVDVQTGGLGLDIFDFQLASDGPDEITDFATGIDQLRISASGFGGGLVEGGTVSLVSGTDPTASDASGQFLYDTDDGSLLWDADGTGSEAAVLVATLSNIPSLAATDFFVTV